MTDKILDIFSNRKGKVIGDYKRSAVMIFCWKKKARFRSYLKPDPKT